MSIHRPIKCYALHHSQYRPLAQRQNHILSTIPSLLSPEIQWVAVGLELSGERLLILGRPAQRIDENTARGPSEHSQPISLLSRYPIQSCTMTNDCRSSSRVFAKPTGHPMEPHSKAIHSLSV